MFQLKKKKNTEVQLEGSQATVPHRRIIIFVLFSLLTNAWGPPTLEGQSAFFSLLIQMLISSRNILVDTSSIMFDQMSGHSVTQSR